MKLIKAFRDLLDAPLLLRLEGMSDREAVDEFLRQSPGARTRIMAHYVAQIDDNNSPASAANSAVTRLTWMANADRQGRFPDVIDPTLLFDHYRPGHAQVADQLTEFERDARKFVSFGKAVDAFPYEYDYAKLYWTCALLKHRAQQDGHGIAELVPLIDRVMTLQGAFVNSGQTFPDLSHASFFGNLNETPSLANGRSLFRVFGAGLAEQVAQGGMLPLNDYFYLLSSGVNHEAINPAILARTAEERDLLSQFEMPQWLADKTRARTEETLAGMGEMLDEWMFAQHMDMQLLQHDQDKVVQTGQQIVDYFCAQWGLPPIRVEIADLDDGTKMEHSGVNNRVRISSSCLNTLQISDLTEGLMHEVTHHDQFYYSVMYLLCEGGLDDALRPAWLDDAREETMRAQWAAMTDDEKDWARVCSVQMAPGAGRLYLPAKILDPRNRYMRQPVEAEAWLVSNVATEWLAAKAGRIKTQAEPYRGSDPSIIDHFQRQAFGEALIRDHALGRDQVLLTTFEQSRDDRLDPVRRYEENLIKAAHQIVLFVHSTEIPLEVKALRESIHDVIAQGRELVSVNKGKPVFQSFEDKMERQLAGMERMLEYLDGHARRFPTDMTPARTNGQGSKPD